MNYKRLHSCPADIDVGCQKNRAWLDLLASCKTLACGLPQSRRRAALMIATACIGLILMAAAVAAAVQPRFDVAAYRPAAAKTPYARPLEVGGWSRIAGEHFFDKRALRRYRAPRLPNSLATGFSDFVSKLDDKAAAEQCLLAAVERYAEQTSRAHFVTYRNNLNKLLGTLHCPNDDWCIGVKRLADKRWLLRVRDTPRRRDEERSQSDAQRLMSYFGYRFEALCTGHEGTMRRQR